MSKIVPKEAEENSWLGRIRDHYFKGKELTPALEERREQLDEAWNLLRKNGRAGAVQILTKRHGLKPATIQKTIRDAIELFGDVTKTSKQGLRQIEADRLDVIYKRALKAGEYKDAIRALEVKSKILRLDQPEADEPRDIRLPVQIIFSTDPSILNPPPVDIDFEPGE